MFGVGTCPVVGDFVRCTCSALGVPTAASGHMQSCPMYTPPAQFTTVTFDWPSKVDWRAIYGTPAED